MRPPTHLSPAHQGYADLGSVARYRKQIYSEKSPECLGHKAQTYRNAAPWPPVHFVKCPSAQTVDHQSK